MYGNVYSTYKKIIIIITNNNDFVVSSLFPHPDQRATVCVCVYTTLYCDNNNYYELKHKLQYTYSL